MLKIYADFNARTPDGLCWILLYNDDDVTDELVKNGERVILYQDGGFEVEATIEKKFVEYLGRKAIVANPDWKTLFDVY